MPPSVNNRILIVDDNPSIHEDFKKILPTSLDQAGSDLDEMLDDVFGQDGQEAEKTDSTAILYELHHAEQGKDAVQMVDDAANKGEPYALVFMDVRMPPGIDGIETTKTIWQQHPNTEVVICTAFSDYSWDDILTELGTNEHLQFLRKPFETISIKQMALALTKKWNLDRQVKRHVDELEDIVAERTKELSEKVEELQKALTEIKELQGILPMCAYCKKIRDDNDYWLRVDEYIRKNSEAEISHGVCPECYDNILKPKLDQITQDSQS